MSKQKEVLALLGTPLLLILAAGCIIGVIYFRNGRRAQALLNDVRSLRVGESTAADVQRIVAKYRGLECQGCSAPGCPSPDMSYYAAVTNVSLNLLAMRFPSLWFALRPRGVVAEFLLEQGSLCYLQYSVGTYPAPHDWPINVTGKMVPAGSGGGPGYPPPYVAFEGGGNVYDLDAQTASDAPVEDRRKAFAFDLSCLSRFGGCRAACELLPSAWLEWQAHSNALSEQTNEPWCNKSAIRNRK